MYDVQSDTGPSYATKRMEAAAALTQLAAGDKTFMERYADFLFKTLDFPEAANMAERAQKFLPPNVLGEQDPTNDPRVQQLMHQASDHIEKLTGELGATKQQLADKQRDLERKEHELELAFRKEGAEQARGDYDAETKRITALGNAGPGMSMEQIQPVIKQLIADMLREGSPAPGPGPHEGGTPIQLPPEPAEGEGATSAAGAANGVTGEAENEPDVPSMPGSQLAPDGRHYIEHSPGQWARVEAGA
jgi:hypothetical protein